MKFCIANYEDISKYFSGTYVKFEGFVGVNGAGEKIDAGEQVHYIKSVQSTTVTGQKLNNDGQTTVDFIFHLQEDGPDVEIVMPKKSYFNWENSAYILYRIPAKQWKKGITKGNTIIQALTYDGFETLDINFQTLNAYVKKPQFLNLEKRGHAYAISRRFAVTSGGKLYLDTTRIGHINYDQQTIGLGHSMFMPELKRALKEHGQSFWNIEIVGAPKKEKKVVGKYTINEEGGLEVNEEE